MANTNNVKIDKQVILNQKAKVFDYLKAKATGLNRLEIDARLKRDGYNTLIEVKKASVFKKLLKRFLSPLVLILFVIGTVSLTLGDQRSALIVYAMIALSVITDFIQEHKSEKTVEKLKEKVSTKVEVIRDRRREMINAKDLVVGDIVCLSVGSIVPADARVFEADDFFVNEASLTGEAFPVSKIPEALTALPADINGQKNIVFSGTNVVSGYARAVVFATGKKTVFGRIAAKLSEPEEETDFEKGVRSFGGLIVKIILSLVVMIFIVNSLIGGKSWFDSLLFSLALAVGLTPELLPMIMSITLARGSINMGKHGVIVKRLNSIHDFGGMDVLCTDKTGTLTENKIKLVKHVDIQGRDSTQLLDYVYLNSYFQSGIANPLDEAVLEIKQKAKVKSWYKLDEIPFDFIRRRLSIVLENVADKNMVLISKGAPEEVLSVCAQYEDVDGSKAFNAVLKQQALEQYNSLSADGFRVLALAYKKITERKTEYDVSEESAMVLLGFIAFLDPAKKKVDKALDLLEDQGVEVKIITGDNDLVTKKICADIDIKIKGVLTGAEIDKLSDADLKAAVENTTIFARVSPEQKAKIVSAIKSNGHCVGYMGDGINDALPLKAADIGISVNNAVDVAKEAADLILLTKNLKVLSLGVAEGRKTFGNTIKYILMGLSSNFGNMFSVAAASFMLPFLPMKPIQILLNNFMYDFSQTTIPLDNIDAEYIKKPKRWDLKFIKKFMFLFGPISSLFDITTFLILLFIFKATEAQFQTAWFMESFATQTLVIFIIRTRQIPFIQSRPSKYLALSVLSFVLLAMVLPFTSLSAYFGFERPQPLIFLAVWGLVAVYLICVELAKKRIYTRYFS